MNKYQYALDRIGRNYYLSQESGDFEHFENLYLENKKTLQELVDKATPKKVLFRQFHSADFMSDCYHSGKCPVCKAENDNYYGDKYCRHCGQALDWSEDE